VKSLRRGHPYVASFQRGMDICTGNIAATRHSAYQRWCVKETQIGKA
jgi:hypothetical protein